MECQKKYWEFWVMVLGRFIEIQGWKPIIELLNLFFRLFFNKMATYNSDKYYYKIGEEIVKSG